MEARSRLLSLAELIVPQHESAAELGHYEASGRRLLALSKVFCIMLPLRVNIMNDKVQSKATLFPLPAAELELCSLHCSLAKYDRREPRSESYNVQC